MKDLKSVSKLGGMVFVDDAFFEMVNDRYLKTNKGIGHLRPHYLAIQDIFNQDLYWVVPVTSKVDKFDRIFNSKIARNRPTDGLRKIKLRGQDRYLLFQDMFPVYGHYLTMYTQSNSEVYLKNDHEDIESLQHQARHVIGLLKRGVKFTKTSPDIKRILQILNNQN